jgi:hypothetical protein
LITETKAQFHASGNAIENRGVAADHYEIAIAFATKIIA